MWEACHYSVGEGKAVCFFTENICVVTSRSGFFWRGSKQERSKENRGTSLFNRWKINFQHCGKKARKVYAPFFCCLLTDDNHHREGLASWLSISICLMRFQRKKNPKQTGNFFQTWSTLNIKVIKCWLSQFRVRSELMPVPLLRTWKLRDVWRKIHNIWSKCPSDKSVTFRSTTLFWDIHSVLRVMT